MRNGFGRTHIDDLIKQRVFPIFVHPLFYVFLFDLNRIPPGSNQSHICPHDRICTIIGTGRELKLQFVVEFRTVCHSSVIFENFLVDFQVIKTSLLAAGGAYTGSSCSNSRSCAPQIPTGLIQFIKTLLSFVLFNALQLYISGLSVHSD